MVEAARNGKLVISILELSADALQTLIAKDAEQSDVLMPAFLLRRLAQISEGLGNVVVLGSQNSSNTCGAVLSPEENL